MADKVFANGLIIKSIDTKFGAMQKLSVKIEDFKEFMDTYRENGWINLNIKTSKEGGKQYIELDTWKPEAKKETRDTSNDISIEELPF